MSGSFHQRLQIDFIQLLLLFIDVKHSSSWKADFYRTINNNNSNTSVVLLGRGEVHGRQTSENCWLLCKTPQFGVVFRAFIKESVQVKLGYRQATCLKCIHLFLTGAPEHIQGLKAEYISWDQSEQRGSEMTTGRVDRSWELLVEVPRATKHGCLKRAAMILGILLICKFVFNFSQNTLFYFCLLLPAAPAVTFCGWPHVTSSICDQFLFR